MSDYIPLSVPTINGNEWKYVRECLDTEWVSSAGKYVGLFEEKIAEYTSAKHAIACINGTAALHVSLLIAGVKDDEEVIVPTLTFIAPINVVKYCNAHPLFMDADSYYNMDISKTIEFIEKETFFNNGYSYNKSSKRRISAIIPVHVFGNAIDMEALVKICSDRNIIVVEDATESLGTVYNSGKYSGKHSGTIGELGCFSFNGNKIITTGGGGMIVTNNDKHAERARYLTTQAKDDPINYIHNEVGYNFRMTNVQAAMGVAQLEQLPTFLKKKKENYMLFKKGLETIDGFSLAETPNYSTNNHWLYALQINDNNEHLYKNKLMEYLGSKKIECRPIWYLNHLQQTFRNCVTHKIEKATDLYNNSFNIPSSSNLTKPDINRIIETLKKWKE